LWRRKELVHLFYEVGGLLELRQFCGCGLVLRDLAGRRDGAGVSDLHALVLILRGPARDERNAHCQGGKRLGLTHAL
jgi:hypothetical protein